MFNISLAKHISWQYLEVEEFAFVYNIKTKKYYMVIFEQEGKKFYFGNC